MSKTDPNFGKCVTPVHIASYVNFLKPVAFKRNGKETGTPKYGYTGLYSEDIKAMKDVAIAVARAKWGDDVDLKTVRFPFKNGDKEADRLVNHKETSKRKPEAQVALLRGKTIVKASSQFKPDVSEFVKGNPEPVEIIDANKIYSGMLGRAELNFVAQGIEEDGEEKKFVTAYINFFLKTGDGQRIGGRDRKSVFSGVMGGESNTDVTDDDIDY